MSHERFLSWAVKTRLFTTVPSNRIPMQIRAFPEALSCQQIPVAGATFPEDVKTKDCLLARNCCRIEGAKRSERRFVRLSLF